ncbi:MAG: dihydrolipoyllysine-residue succinyltransferase, partial [Planctomycetaceae bacterium]|nr:dihydrolipoyllysine-residue succinyltransferase [Planctomycetaceae bacterium]
MPIEVVVPRVGESITEVRLGDWRKSPGEAVASDEVLIELESEKATFDLPAPSAGVLLKVLKEGGSTAAIGEAIAIIDEAAVPAGAAKPAGKPAGEKSAASPAASAASADPSSTGKKGDGHVMPSAARVAHDLGVSAQQATGTGPGGRITKEDVEKVSKPSKPEAPASVPVKASKAPTEIVPAPATAAGSRQDQVVSMTLLRRRIAERLVMAKQNAALLTTFNEVDMSGVMELRNRFKDTFQQKHGVKLGFMSFFVRAAVEALRAYPGVNAEIRGTDMIYHHYCDIGVAIGGGKGLVVPVLRNAETMGFAEIERRITDFAVRAKDNALMPEELTGGTFTISNGGVYGSMLSTPIVNPPQSGVLG